MVLAVSEHAYSVLKAGLPRPDRREALPRPGAGTSRSAVGTIDDADRRTSRQRLAIRGDCERKPSITHYDTLEMFAAASFARRAPGDWAHPTRSVCTSRRCTTRAAATRPTALTRCSRPGWAWIGSGCTPRELAFAHLQTGAKCGLSASTLTTCSTRLTSCGRVARSHLRPIRHALAWRPAGVRPALRVDAVTDARSFVHLHNHTGIRCSTVRRRSVPSSRRPSASE